jgi:hypothetical protein
MMFRLAILIVLAAVTAPAQRKPGLPLEHLPGNVELLAPAISARDLGDGLIQRGKPGTVSKSEMRRCRKHGQLQGCGRREGLTSGRGKVLKKGLAQNRPVLAGARR